MVSLAHTYTLGWKFYPKPAGLDLYSRVGGLWQAKIIFAISFYFFIALFLYFFLDIFLFFVSIIHYNTVFSYFEDKLLLF